ncbi:MAG: spherulation-specific family 4 protein [Thermomicrobiales bacterium]|nr:spherulation-specific family 4 protein [Thermomicrobiales bacterium]
MIAVLVLGGIVPSIGLGPAANAAAAIDGAGMAKDSGVRAAAKAKKKAGKKADKKAKKKAGKKSGKKNRGRKHGKRPGNTRPQDPVTTPSDPKPPATNPQSCLQIAVPAYFEESHWWDEMTQAAPATGMIVLNLYNGPDKPSEYWKGRTQAAQRAGIKVVGYVLTGHGKRDKNLVKQDIRNHFDWFGVDGIYLDETSSAEDDKIVDYYREMATYVRQIKPKATVVVNSGYTPDERFMEFADIIENYEYDYDTYLKQKFPSWTLKYAANRFIHVVHSVPGTDAAKQTLDLARQRNAGYVFLTDVEDTNYIYKSLGGTLWNTQVRGLCPS